MNTSITTKDIVSHGACDLTPKAWALYQAIKPVDTQGIALSAVPVSDGWSNRVAVAARWAHLFNCVRGNVGVTGTLSASPEGAAMCSVKKTLYGALNGYQAVLPEDLLADPVAQHTNDRQRGPRG